MVLSVGRPAPQASAGGVVSAASYAGTAVAPGEIVTIFGSNFGDQARVFFDDIAATIIYVTLTQLSATVPYEVAGVVTRLVVESQNLRSAPVNVPVVSAKPALFTAGASGKGEAAALNQDASINGPSNPAKVIVQVGDALSQEEVTIALR